MFGVLGMLVSVASFLPIIIVGPISDLVGTTAVIFVLAIAVMLVGIVSVLTRGPVVAADASPAADPRAVDPIASALGADLPTWTGHVVDPVADPVPVPAPATLPGQQLGSPAPDPVMGDGPLVPGHAGPSDPTDRD